MTYLILSIILVSVGWYLFYLRANIIDIHSGYINNKETAYALIDLNGFIHDSNIHFKNLFHISQKKDSLKTGIFDLIKKEDDVLGIFLLKNILKKCKKKISFEYVFTDSKNKIISSVISIYKSPINKMNKYYCLEVNPKENHQLSEDIKTEITDSEYHKINNLLTIVMGSVQILNIYSKPNIKDEETAVKISKQMNDAKEAIRKINKILKNKNSIDIID